MVLSESLKNRRCLWYRCFYGHFHVSIPFSSSACGALNRLFDFHTVDEIRLLFRSFDFQAKWKLDKWCTHWFMQKIFFLVLYCIGCRTQLHYLKNASTIEEIRDRGIRYVHVSAKRRRWKSRTGCSTQKLCEGRVWCVCAGATNHSVLIQPNIPMHSVAKTIVNHLVRDNHSSVTLSKAQHFVRVFCFSVSKCAYTYRSVHISACGVCVCVYIYYGYRVFRPSRVEFVVLFYIFMR